MSLQVSSASTPADSIPLLIPRSQNGLSTYANERNNLDLDFEEVMGERTRDQKYIQKHIAANLVHFPPVMESRTETSSTMTVVVPEAALTMSDIHGLAHFLAKDFDFDVAEARALDPDWYCAQVECSGVSRWHGVLIRDLTIERCQTVTLVRDLPGYAGESLSRSFLEAVGLFLALLLLLGAFSFLATSDQLDDNPSAPAAHAPNTGERS